MQNDREAYFDFTEKAFENHANNIFSERMTKSGVIRRRSFSDAKNTVNAAEKFLESLGFAHGDRAAVLCTDEDETFLTFLALSRCGVTSVLLDPSSEKEELTRLLVFSDVRAVFCDTAIFPNISEEIRRRIPVFAPFGSGKDGVSFGNIVKLPDDTQCPPTCDSAAIMFSSGTTSEKKGVELSYRALIKVAPVPKNDWALDESGSWLQPLPVFHIAGLEACIASLYIGNRRCYSENPEPFIIPSLLQVFQPTHFGFVPRLFELFIQKMESVLASRKILWVYRALNALSGFLLSKFGAVKLCRFIMTPFRRKLFGKNLRVAMTGAAPADPPTVRKLLNMGLLYCNLYGSTESAPPVTCVTVRDSCRVDSVGKADGYKSLGVEVKIDSPDENGIGEILSKSPMIMNGYFRDPELTKKAFDGDWFRMGDSGYIDADGYLHITGRCKENIVMENGEKVSPTYIEKLYEKAIPQGVAFAAAAVPDKKSGCDTLHLFIERGSLSDSDTERIGEELEAIRRKEGSAYALKGIHFIESLPRTSVGKVKRYMLRDMTGENAASAEVSAKKTAYTRDELLDGVITVIREMSGIKGDISEADSFRETLGLDSLTLISVFTEIDSRFSSDTQAFVGLLDTAGQTADYLYDKNSLPSDISKSDDYAINSYPRKRNIFHRAAFRVTGAFFSRAVSLDVEGLENIPDGAAVLCPNHQCFLDALWVIHAVSRKCDFKCNIGCMVKKEVFDKKLSSFFAAAYGGIPVDRLGNTLKAFVRCEEFVKDGGKIVIFPEGTFGSEKELLPFKNGAAEIASATGVPLIPVSIRGAAALLPPYQKKLCLRDKNTGKRNTVSLRFGAPIYPCTSDADELTSSLRKAVEEGLENPEERKKIDR